MVGCWVCESRRKRRVVGLSHFLALYESLDKKIDVTASKKRYIIYFFFKGILVLKIILCLSVLEKVSICMEYTKKIRTLYFLRV